jgi:hypothetical protein
MRKKMADPRPPIEKASVERDLETIRSTLSGSDFQRLTVDGQVMTLEDALALAMDD